MERGNDPGGVQPGFGMAGEAVDEVAVGGVKGSDSVERDDDRARLDEEDTVEDERQKGERDLSSMDTWMGVLSASSVKYFVRIVPSSEVGVVSLADHERSRMK